MGIISSGTVNVSSGVTSTGLLVLQEGVLQVLNEGMAQEIGLADNGKAVVSNGGTLYVCTVSAGGTATVLRGGYAQEVVVDGGLFAVSSGGTAYLSLLKSGGTQTVYADAMLVSAFVMDGCMLDVKDGGYARLPVVSQGGVLQVWKNAVIDQTHIHGSAGVNANGALNSATVFDGGRVDVQSLGYAYRAVVSSGGVLDISSGGIVNSVTVHDGGAATIAAGGSGYNAKISGGIVTLAGGTVPGGAKGGYMSKASVDSGGKLEIFSGGTAKEVQENGGYVEISEGASVTFASNTISGLELADSATVHAGTTATATTVNAGGRLEVFSGGTVNGVTVNPGGMAEVSSGVISGAVVNADGSLLIYDGTRITGHMTFEDGAIVIPFVGSILDFDLTQTEAGAEALVNDLSILMGTPSYTLTVSDAQAEGTYSLAEGAAKFTGTISVVNASGESFGILAVGEKVKIGEIGYTLNLTGSLLSVAVEDGVLPPPEDPVGTADKVSWKASGADGYVVEYSTDGFKHVISVVTAGNAVDTPDLPAGTYQWRVRADAEYSEWAVGEAIVSELEPGAPEVVRSNEDGNDDLFFATANGTWENIYYAQNVGSINDWTGTNEIISANGKGRIQNLFFGSTDPNVLCLTDGENGDAIFVDDVYTELPESVAEHTARLYKIQEVRAGAGDDIVDMTSQRFEYVGDGLTIRGGDGNDTIWATKGDNWLFGDAGNDRIVGASGNDVIIGGIGNDRMHGGGGGDIFTFCDNWGTDTVEQLASGSVTLWFASGDESKWDSTSMTYTDGDNSVKVTGVTSVELKFGDDDSEQYATLAQAGAFLDFTSERIFEESGKGVLASL